MNNFWVCVDANLVIYLVINGPHTILITNLWTTWHEAGRSVAAPTLLYYEVSNVLHRYVVHGYLRSGEADRALQAALDLGLTLYGDANLHQRALELAKRYSFPAAYDAHYLALAERLGADFWTADQRLAQAVQADLPWVHLAK